MQAECDRATPAAAELFKRILDDKDFRELLGDFYVSRVYEKLREES